MKLLIDNPENGRKEEKISPKNAPLPPQQLPSSLETVFLKCGCLHYGPAIKCIGMWDKYPSV